MHELSICQALVAEVESVARTNGGRAICVWVDVGVLSGTEPHLLRIAFPLVAVGSFAEGCDLQLNTVPARVLCRSCGAESAVPANRLVCAVCGNWQTDIVAGDELRLVRVELSEAT